ncbi:MAG TPA: polymer-forming cytoskeletal protein, partial [Longimicrobium sp.]|nr:polymer-forming cytoskeletal protein [Longimicrobium sp.]
ALAAAALAAPPGARAQAAPEAPPAPAAAAAPLAPAPPAAPVVTKGSKIAFNGLTVPRGHIVDGDVVAPFGDVRIEGEVTGNVVVGKGNLVLVPGAVIHGDAVVNGGGQLLNEGGRILGAMEVNTGDEDDAVAPEAPQVDGGQASHSVVENIRIHRHGWWGSMQEGFEGLISTITFALILCGLGAALVFYGRPQLERVTHVVRTDTGRAAGIGVASMFLALPAFFLALVVLIVTIIGIPVAVLFAPLFWVVLGAAWLYGLIAVAHTIGERTAEQSGSFASMRRNAYTYVFTGVGLLLAPLVVGNLLKLTGFLGWLGTLVNGLGWTLLFATGLVGFGAVALTRGGTRTGWPWNVRTHEYDPIFDEEPAFERPAREAHV